MPKLWNLGPFFHLVPIHRWFSHELCAFSRAKRIMGFWTFSWTYSSTTIKIQPIFQSSIYATSIQDSALIPICNANKQSMIAYFQFEALFIPVSILFTHQFEVQNCVPRRFVYYRLIQGLMGKKWLLQSNRSNEKAIYQICTKTKHYFNAITRIDMTAGKLRGWRHSGTSD